MRTDNKKIPGLTVREIAADLGLSIATVSRVLNNKPDVNSQSRERVLAHLRTIGYQPPVISSDLNLIGLVDSFERHNLNGYYMSNLLAGTEHYLHRYGYNVVLIHYDQIESEMKQFGQAIILNRLKGVLWLEPMFDSSHMEIVKKHNLACVVINNSAEDVQVDIVQSDNYHAALRGIDFLISKGHRRIAFVGGWLHLANHRDRLKGFLEATTKASLSVPDSLIVRDVVSWDEHGGYEGTHQVMSVDQPPTAIMLCSDFLATGAYTAISDLKLSITQDVSIVSFDDFPLAQFMNPPLTTFRQPLRDMASLAVTRLMDLIKQKSKKPITHLVDCPLIVRQSVGRNN